MKFIIANRQGLSRRLQTFLPVALLGALGLYTLWPWLPNSGAGQPPRTIVFYGFSILNEVMTEAIFPAFQEAWQAQTGQRVEFVSAFAGSGTITNQLIMGVPADLALVSLELDAQRLSEADVISPQSWQRLPHKGVVNRTPFIILVRPGNPKEIHDFTDLARPGITLVHPDPLTSGAANWALVAEYGAAVRHAAAGADESRLGRDLMAGIWRNVVAQGSSARVARTQFENGFGDALITYEQEALWDQGRGRLQARIVYPPSTILSEHTLVVIEGNVEPEERELVAAFVDFLWSEPAQSLFVTYGFHSVLDGLDAANPAFGIIADPFLIDDLGGWTRAKKEIVDDIWKTQILPELGR